MSDIEPRPGGKGEVAPRHIPNEVYAVPIDEARSVVSSAIGGTSLTSLGGRIYTGNWMFDMRMRLTPVDETHTRIELLATAGKTIDMLFFNHRRAAIDRFFVAIQDELDRREKWRPAVERPEVEG